MQATNTAVLKIITKNHCSLLGLKTGDSPPGDGPINGLPVIQELFGTLFLSPSKAWRLLAVNWRILFFRPGNGRLEHSRHRLQRLNFHSSDPRELATE